MNTIDITNMSNRQIEEVIQDGLTELQDREYGIFDEAISKGIGVLQIDPKYRENYISYLEHNSTVGDPDIRDILEEWHNEQDIIQSRKTTGA